MMIREMKNGYSLPDYIKKTLHRNRSLSGVETGR